MKALPRAFALAALLLVTLLSAALLIAGCASATAKGAPGSEAARLFIRQSEPIYSSDALKVHAYQTTASNVYLIETDAGVTLVDAGLPTSERPILHRLEEIGRSGDLCQIFLTHAHIDHVGAASALHAETGAPILIHEADADALRAGRTRLGSIRNWQWTRDALPMVENLVGVAAAEPDVTFAGGDAVAGCGLDAYALHIPGHTDGSAALIVSDPATGATLAFVGDLISTTGGPHVQSSYASDWGEVAASFRTLQTLAPDITFPGHGTMLLTAADLAALELTGPAAR